MIRRINKVISLILITASICAIAPVSESFIQTASAAENNESQINIDTQVNNIALAGPADLIAAVPDGNVLITTAESSINNTLEQGVNKIFQVQGASSNVNEQCGSLSYTLSDASINTISNLVLPQLKGAVTSAVAAQMAAKTKLPQATIEGIICPTVE